MPSPDLIRLNQDAIVELFILDLSPIGENALFRFCAQPRSPNNPVSFAGRIFDPMPIEASGFELTGKEIPTPQLRIANVGGIISLLLLQYKKFLKAKVTRILTFAKHLDGGTEANGAMELDRSIWFIDRIASEDKTQITFELSSSLDLQGVQLPHRCILANNCWWVSEYRGAECGYTGSNFFDKNGNPVGTLAQDECGGRLSDCEKRFGARQPLSFGGFPGAGNNNFG